MSARTTAGAIGACAALVMACGLTATTATATPVAGHPGITNARNATAGSATTAANPCTEGAALSGHAVSGALPRTEVHRRLASLTERHREARGYRTDEGPALSGKGPLGTGGRALPAADIHPAQGTAFKEIDGSDGACATQSLSTTINVQDASTTIYTPTMYPAGGSCIELVTVYTRGSASVSAWDWCSSVAFEASAPIDGAFLGTYTDGTATAYTGRVIRTDAGSNTWSAALYNYRTHSWDELFTQSGQTRGRTDGWDIYELYSQTDSSGVAYSCHAMAGQTFESSNISVRVNGRWAAANPENSDTHYDSPDSGFYCPDRTYGMVSQYDHWKATG